MHWKNWCWSWNSHILATLCEEMTHWERPWCWQRLKAGGERTTEDEMDGWHHWVYGNEFEQASGVAIDREAWCAAVLGVVIVRHDLSHWTELIGLDPKILVFWMLSFKPAFSLSFITFQFHKRLFSSLLSAVRVMSSSISEIMAISPSSLDSGLCFIQASISYDA